MNKKLKGFSLAELLISLLIISIVLSAAIPTLTKKSGANREFIWSWSTQNNSAYFGTGANQTAIIGYDKNPVMSKIDDAWMVTSPLQDILYDADNINDNALYNNDHARGIPKVNLGGVLFNGTGDKLVLLKKPILARTATTEEEKNIDESMFANSHITFYTLKNNTTTDSPTTGDIKYTGRITMDLGNIAIGLGTLQNQVWNKSNINEMGENTAVGHFALLRNSEGIRNTALGKKTLSANETGSYNTALGFGSLYKLGAVSLEGLTINTNKAYNDNTAVGVFSQMQNSIGGENTSVGAHSLKHLYYSQSDYTTETKPKYQALGNGNTAIGAGAMEFVLSGNENTAVGLNACSAIPKGSNNICIGANSGFDGITALKKDNFGIYIGTTTDDDNLKEPPYLDEISGTQKIKFSVPLISGHTRKTQSYRVDDTAETQPVKYHQELNVNAKQVVFKPFNASFDAFKFESMIGKAGDADEEGYGLLGSNDVQKKSKWARASFKLRDTGDGVDDDTTVQLQFSAEGKTKYTPNNKILYLDANNPYAPTNSNSLATIVFNRMLKFEFPFQYNASETIESNKEKMVAGIYAIGGESGSVGLPLILNDKIKVRNEAYAPAMEIKSGKFFLGSEKSSDGDIKTKVEMYVPSSSSAASKSNITITQKEKTENKVYVEQSVGETNKFEIEQTSGTTQNFMVRQNISEGHPKLQLQNGEFYADTLSLAKIQAKKVEIQGGEDSEIRLGSVNVKQDIENLKSRVDSYHPSDIRLKNVSGDSTAGLKEINALEVKNFTFKNDKEKTPHVGVIAQQLQKIFPNAVIKGEDGYLKIRTEDIFYAMVNSIKDLFKQLQELTAKVTGLDSRITELEKQNKLLQEQNKLLKKQNKAIEKRLAKLERQAAK